MLRKIVPGLSIGKTIAQLGRKVEWLNPRTIKVHDLEEHERRLFLQCRTAIFHNDYKAIAPLVDNPQNINSPVVLSCLVEALGKMGRVRQMEQVLDSWLRNEMNKPTLVLLEIVLDKLLYYGLADKATNWQSVFASKGIKAGIGVRNVWITYYLHVNNLSRAKTAFEEIKRDRLFPNRVTYSQFYKYFMHQNDFSAAEQSKASMIASGITPNVSFYNMQLSLLFTKMMLREVEQVIEEMKQKGVWMEASTFDMLVAGYAFCGKKPEMEKWLWERGKEIGSKMSQRSYSRLIEALGMNMSPEQCKDIFSELENNISVDGNCSFNVYVYFSLISAFLEQKRYDEVVELFKELQRLDMALPESFYIRIASKCIYSRFPYGISFVRDEMAKHRICKSPSYYNLLLKYHLNKREYDKVDELIREMFSGGVYLKEEILCNIIDHLCTAAHYNKTREVLEWLADQAQPHFLTLSTRIIECLHRAIYLYTSKNLGGYLTRVKRVIDRDCDGPLDVHTEIRPPNLLAIQERFQEAFPGVPFTPTVHVFNDMLVHCLQSGHFDESFNVFNEMRRQFISPNLFTFTYLIKARLWLGQPDEARRLLFEMRKYGWRPSQFHFGLVHHAHCRLGMTTEAEALLKEMTECFHVLPNHVFYAALLFAHCRRFEYTAVFRTFETMERSGLKPDTETSNFVLLSLFDVGEYAEAMQFFSRMCLEGIRRNTYTYTIMADRMLARDDVDGMMGILGDAEQGGNVIDAFPFLRILSYLHSRLAHEAMERLVDLMVNLGIRLDSTVIPFVLFVFNRKLAKLDCEPSDSENELYIRRLLEKALIDMNTDSTGAELMAGSMHKLTRVSEQSALWEARERLISYYVKHNKLDCKMSLDQFTDALPELRKLFLESNGSGKKRKIRLEDSPPFEAPSIADLLAATRLCTPPLVIFTAQQQQ